MPPPPPPVGAASYRSLRTAAVATAVVFGLSGGAFATWVSRLPEVRNHLHADPGQLGIALLGSGVGAIFSTALTGMLVRRWGSRPVVAATCVLSNLALVALAFVPNVQVLGIVLLVFGFGYGSWDVSMNVHGNAVERHAHKAWMPRYHAVWSVGSFGFAGLGTLMSHLHVPIPLHFAGYAVVSIGGVFAMLLLFVDDREPVIDAATGAAPPRARFARLRLLATLGPLAIVMACSTVIEGAASDWLGIYFNTERHVSPAAGSLAFTLFEVAMAASRFAGTWTIGRLGRVWALRASGFAALVGIAVVLHAPTAGLAYVGAALWGLGVAIIFPAVISAAGDTPGRSAEAIATVTPVGYAGFLVGPPAIGLLANHFTLENALWFVGALAVLVIALAGFTRAKAHPRVSQPAASAAQ